MLLHAFPLSSAIWVRLDPFLVGHRVVHVDLPGLGRSGVPDADPSVDVMADAVAAVLDHLDVATATVLGISTGGYVALALAGREPERLTGLVLASTTPWVTTPDVPAERRDLADRIERAGSMVGFTDLADGGVGPTARAEQPELLDLVRGLVADADPAGVAWAARALAARRDTSVALVDVACPVLLLFGAEDTDTPAARGEEMRDLRASGPHGPGTRPTRLEVLPATGHLTPLERPEWVAAVLGEFLGQDGPGE